MKYPAIIKNENGTQTVLMFDESNAVHLDGDFKGKLATDYFVGRGCTNITHEYLSNTWGVVESKEHADFIIELAEFHGFKVIKWGEKITHFNFRFVYGEMVLNLLGFRFSKDDLKQITIPLPPKAKEWPQVGDKVRWDKNDYLGTVKAISEDKAWCKLDNGLYYTINFDRLAKPKSKQELLIEELQTKLCNNNAVDNYILACDIINGEIEGLSYE